MKKPQVARKKTRKLLFQKLYARIFCEVDTELFTGAFFRDIFDYTPDLDYLDEMFSLIVEHEKYFLNVIEKYAPRFDIETMNKASIIAICIGICEMKFLSEEVPAKVSINEAVEMWKVFGDESSSKVVNGILNSYYKNFDSHSDIDQYTHFSGVLFPVG